MAIKRAVQAEVPGAPAGEHDRWFRAEVERTLAGVSDGSIGLIDEAEWRATAAAMRSALERKAGGDRG